jgi:hypothetical protein
MPDAAPLLASGLSEDVTPRRPIALAGYGDRTAPSTSVRDALEVGALLLKQGDSALLFLSFDLLYVPDELQRAVLELAREKLGLAPSHVLLAASHTHSAPALFPDKSKLGAPDEDYARFLEERVLRLVETCLAVPPSPVSVAYSEGLWDGGVNRRRRGWTYGLRKRTRMQPNPRGPIDRTFRTLTFRDERDAVRAVIWSASCHPSAVPDMHAVSADFPGIVRERLRSARRSPSLPVLFLQGFSGDANPDIIESRPSGLERIKRVLRGPRFGRFDESEYVRWAEGLAAAVDRSANAGRRVEASLAAHDASVPLDELVSGAGARGREPLRAQRLELGRDLQIVALSCEPVAAYVARLARRFPGRTTIPVGYTSPLFGYLPTNAMIRDEGGYEVDEFFEAFGLTGRFRPDVESVFDRVVGALDPKPQKLA